MPRKSAMVWTLFRILGLALLLLGCAPAKQPESSAPSDQPKYGGVMRLRRSDEAPHLDTHLTSSYHTQYYMGLVYSRLLTFKSGADVNRNDITPVPDLAERWEQPDTTTYVFYLRKDVKWQNVPPLNGREFTSDDVKYTFERMKDPKTKSTQAYMMAFLDRIETPDKYTVKFVLKKPFAPMIYYLSSHHAWIIPREVVQADGDLKKRAIGTGPFILDKWEQNVRAVFRKNPDYFRQGLPYLDGVELLVIPDESQALAAFMAGELDVLDQRRAFEADTVKKSIPNVVVQKELMPPFGTVLLGQKTPVEALKNLKVRQAMSLALDRQEIMETVYGKGGAALTGFIPPSGREWALPQEEIEKHFGKRDLAQAKRLLAEAGYPNGFKAVFSVAPQYGNAYVDGAQIIMRQLKEVGIETEYKSMEYAEHQKARQELTYQLYFGPTRPVYFDPDEWLYESFYPGSSRNSSGADDPKLNAMMVAQREAVDRDKRLKLVQETDRYLIEQGLYELPVAQSYSFDLIHPHVKSYAYHSSYGYHSLYQVWLAK